MLRYNYFKGSFNVKLLVIGVVCAIITSIILVAGVSLLIENGNMGDNMSTYGVGFAYLVSSLIAGMVVKYGGKERNVLMSLLVGVGYIAVVMIINLLIYSNGVDGFGLMIACVVIGILLSLIQKRQVRRFRGHTKKVRFR